MSPRRKQKATLASIAKELGVSRTTVSNAYNHPDQLSEELRRKILAAADRLGYAGPDPTARSLRTRRTGSVGVLFTDYLTYAFEDAATCDYLAGLSTATTESGNSLQLIPAGPGATDLHNDATGMVRQAAVDGFAVYSVAKDDPFLESARSRDLPVVICDQPFDFIELPFVGIDDRIAIRPAAEALIAAGHRKIGILCIRLDRRRNDGPVSLVRLNHASMHVQKNRVLGALDVFQEHGLQAADIPIVERHINDPANNFAAAEELLTTNPELTAVLCTTDSMAFGVLEFLKHNELSAPADLSVTGFDGVAHAMQIGLSTVIQPNKEKGRAAGKLLMELIAASHHGNLPQPPQRIILQTTYAPGATVAAPRSQALRLRPAS